jgi:single-stranded DNA-binding protein
MQKINMVILEGNLTKDAEKKEINGKTLTVFTLASNYFYYVEGIEEAKKETYFLDVESWTAADKLDKLTKGREVRVTGRLRIETWKTGSEDKPEYHSRTKIVAHTVEIGYEPKAKADSDAE